MNELMWMGCEDVCRGGKGGAGESVKGLTNRTAQDVNGVTKLGVGMDRSKKPEGPTHDCQKPEADKMQRGVYFLLLATCF
jgi:hypothetical protein